MSKKVILFTLQTFSTTGGIQKMTRTMAHAFDQLERSGDCRFRLWSLYDKDIDLMPQYLPAGHFKGFRNRRWLFFKACIQQAFYPDIIIISHINLAVVGLLIRAINPRCKVWLIAHGIEVWRPLSFFKNKLIAGCDQILCVSRFTRDEIVRMHAVEPARCRILNNAVDPFMDLGFDFKKPSALAQKYGTAGQGPVLFTLTRLASTEQYKGHEQVLRVLPQLRLRYPAIKYILGGQCDAAEFVRIQALINEYQVADCVILPGFIKEQELSDHFLLADLFVLPSKKEGFGIVFIEAMACGLPVICGNADGSRDAVRDGELGTAIQADDREDLRLAIAQALEQPVTSDSRKLLQEKCLLYFNETEYRKRLFELITVN
jgi:phosphatidylinositol alpha-1,6-mannosyltransferase